MGESGTHANLLHRASGRGTGDPQEIGTYWLAIARGCRTATSNHCGLGGHGRSKMGTAVQAGPPRAGRLCSGSAGTGTQRIASDRERAFSKFP